MTSVHRRTQRRLLCPEIVQTSTMDCGPAALAAAFAGFNKPLSYGRLREACQTGVDGTSISTLAEVSTALGLEATETMLPADYLLHGTSVSLPCVAVVRDPAGAPHFVVIWRAFGSLYQVLDPASGRLWLRREALKQRLFEHRQVVPADAWREWAGSEDAVRVLRSHLVTLCGDVHAQSLLARANEDSSWRGLAGLDAAARFVRTIATSQRLTKDAAAHLLEQLCAVPNQIPDEEWMVRELREDPASLVLRGAVAVTFAGPIPATATLAELRAVADEAPERPLRELWALMREQGFGPLTAILTGAVAGAVMLLVQTVLMRSVFDLGQRLERPMQRLVAVAMLAVFVGAQTVIEWTAHSSVMRLGRRVEIGMLTRILAKIPRIGDRYFQSRPASDMADRVHGLHQLRQVPVMLSRLVRVTLQICVMVAALAYLDPRSAPLVLLLAALPLALALFLNPLLTERHLRSQTHQGALARFVLDALLGSVALRAHNAEPALRREHELLSAEWVRAQRSLLLASLGSEFTQLALAQAAAVTLILSALPRMHDHTGILVFAFWALQLPSLGMELGQLLRHFPLVRNVLLRANEPLRAPEEEADAAAPSVPPTGGVALRFEGVTVRAGGHAILLDVETEIAAGSHVAIVGASGAGKSSLVGLLLGWHRPAAGRVLVDGVPLEGSVLHLLREHTAWVDPAVTLWNRSLFDNLRYGSDPAANIDAVIRDARLVEVIERFADGLQARLGEAGALLSGGEGQRVRFGRALSRKNIRLAILDEPFRGLGRQERQALLTCAKKAFAGATLLAITHDVAETQAFDRVLVIAEGRVIEDAPPSQLAQQPESAYAKLLLEEEEVRKGLWRHPSWRRFVFENGELEEKGHGDED